MLTFRLVGHPVTFTGATVLIVLVPMFGFFLAGVTAQRMFARKFGKSSRAENILLSPGLYMFPMLFLPAFESESGDPSAHQIIFVMAYLLVFTVSFAGVQYSNRNAERRGPRQDDGHSPGPEGAEQ